jgi:hypothetical protein
MDNNATRRSPRVARTQRRVVSLADLWWRVMQNRLLMIGSPVRRLCGWLVFVTDVEIASPEMNSKRRAKSFGNTFCEHLRVLLWMRFDCFDGIRRLNRELIADLGWWATGACRTAHVSFT